MPRRKTFLATGEIYHIFNKTIGNERAFLNKKHNQRFLDLIDYYRFPQPKRYSYFARLSQRKKLEYWAKVKKTIPLAEIYAFAIMPNHFHFLLKQPEVEGISKFMSNLQNSFAKYFNLRNNRSGSLFQNMFKAKRVENEEQLIHISRYIHLNPVSSFLIEINQLPEYPWTSLPCYLGRDFAGVISPDLILGVFGLAKKYQQFIFDQADYQRKLQQIKHLLIKHP